MRLLLTAAASHSSRNLLRNLGNTYPFLDQHIASNPSRTSAHCLFLQYVHAVLLVGYDLEQQFWIAKNSWGQGFADGGFFKMKMGVASVANTQNTYGLEWFFNGDPPLKVLAIPATRKGCYLYTATPAEPYLSKVADTFGLDVKKLALDNVDRVEDLGQNIVGKTLLLCDVDSDLVTIELPGAAAAAAVTTEAAPTPTPGPTAVPSSPTAAMGGSSGSNIASSSSTRSSGDGTATTSSNDGWTTVTRSSDGSSSGGRTTTRSTGSGSSSGSDGWTTRSSGDSDGWTPVPSSSSGTTSRRGGSSSSGSGSAPLGGLLPFQVGGAPSGGGGGGGGFGLPIGFGRRKKFLH